MGNQFEYDFLTGDGIVAGSLNDMWQRFFDQEGIDGLNLNDRMMKYFGSLGYEGSLSDRYHRWEKGETPVVPPTAITDFAASDDEIEQFTFTWSNAGGTTPITYALFKDGVFQIDDVSSGLVLPLAGGGSASFSVRATNSAGSTMSNDDDGTALPAAVAVTHEGIQVTFNGEAVYHNA